MCSLTGGYMLIEDLAVPSVHLYRRVYVTEDLSVRSIGRFMLSKDLSVPMCPSINGFMLYFFF